MARLGLRQPTDVVVIDPSPRSVVASYAQLWPTSVDASGRFIRDQNGNPWMMHGEAAWSLDVGVNLADAQAFLDDRAAWGINLVSVMAIVHSQATSAPNDFAGNPPFTGTAFQSSLNSSYWSHLDSIISYAASRGITVLLFPAYLGFDNTQGWSAELGAATNGQMQTYGQTIGARYASSPNIIWSVGGDRTPSATDLDRQDNMMIGVRAGGANQLVTAHGNDGTDSATAYNSYSWLGLNAVYDNTANNIITTATTAYNRTTVRPTFLIEQRYLNYTGVTLTSCRRDQWQAILVGGIGGHIVGNESVWPFGYNTTFSTADYNWRPHLTDADIVHTGNMAFLVNQYPTTWCQLRPDLSDTFMTAGEGTGANQAAASYGSDLGMIYKPAATSTTIALTVFGAHRFMRVRWFDPTNATFVPVGIFATTGSQAIAHPGTNSVGDNDWVLVVDSADGMPGQLLTAPPYAPVRAGSW